MCTCAHSCSSWKSGASFCVAWQLRHSSVSSVRQGLSVCLSVYVYMHTWNPVIARYQDKAGMQFHVFMPRLVYFSSSLSWTLHYFGHWDTQRACYALLPYRRVLKFFSGICTVWENFTPKISSISCKSSSVNQIPQPGFGRMAVSFTWSQINKVTADKVSVALHSHFYLGIRFYFLSYYLYIFSIPLLYVFFF